MAGLFLEPTGLEVKRGLKARTSCLDERHHPINLRKEWNLFRIE